MSIVLIDLVIPDVKIISGTWHKFYERRGFIGLVNVIHGL